MKLWEILPQLKEGQTINVTYKDGHQDNFIYGNGSVRRAENGFIMVLHRENFEADYEIIPQYVPFEEALKALREGKRVRCESEKYGEEYFHRESGQYAIRVKEILEGKWSIC